MRRNDGQRAGQRQVSAGLHEGEHGGIGGLGRRRNELAGKAGQFSRRRDVADEQGVEDRHAGHLLLPNHGARAVPGGDIIALHVRIVECFGAEPEQGLIFRIRLRSHPWLNMAG